MFLCITPCFMSRSCPEDRPPPIVGSSTVGEGGELIKPRALRIFLSERLEPPIMAGAW